MNLGPVNDTELLVFLAELNAKRKAHYVACYTNTYGGDGNTAYEDRELLALEIGKKYLRVVTTHKVDAHATPQCIREVTTVGGRVRREVASAFCFIDKETGDILKPKGFGGPVKGARGNIRGDYWNRAVNAYGVRNLR